MSRSYSLTHSDVYPTGCFLCHFQPKSGDVFGEIGGCGAGEICSPALGGRDERAHLVAGVRGRIETPRWSTREVCLERHITAVPALTLGPA